MRNSIRYQLFARVITILFFILLLTAAGQVCILLLKKTSNKVFTEYVELDAIQDYESSLNQLFIQFSTTIIDNSEQDRKELQKVFIWVNNRFEHLNNSLTARHNRDALSKVKTDIEKLHVLSNKLIYSKLSDIELKEFQKEVANITQSSRQIIEEFKHETKIEIEHYIVLNNTAVKHSTITIVTLGILLVLISIIGGNYFIKKLTGPIAKLLASTKAVEAGKLSTKVVINSNIEFNELATSFNSMTQNLKNTTISRDYYDSILRNMTEVVLVTKQNGMIQTANDATSNLLGYSVDELLKSKVNQLFDKKFNKKIENFRNDKSRREIRFAECNLVAKNGTKIPVLLSLSVIRNKQNSSTGMIFLAYDLSEKIAIEKKLEQERKEKMVAINDAQEEEKFRIAIDLHDGLGQILTAISYTIQNHFTQYYAHDTDFHSKVHEVQLQLDSAIAETKNIAHNLIPIALKDFGLLTATQNLIDRINQRANTKFVFNTYNYNERINAKLEKAIYRIFQEAINNIVKHSKAKNASFQINKYNDLLVIVIEDDGIGFELNENSNHDKQGGIGLIGMKERIMAFNGSFTINTNPNSGTEILIEIPYEHKSL